MEISLAIHRPALNPGLPESDLALVGPYFVPFCFAQSIEVSECSESGPTLTSD